jgi:diketogulonate reductase-like aldo/keto reductase
MRSSRFFTDPRYIAGNANILDFALEDSQMAALDTLHED